MARPQQSRLAFVERLVPEFRDYLADSTVSYRDLVAMLKEQHGVEVSYETLRRWANELGYRQEPAA